MELPTPWCLLFRIVTMESRPILAFLLWIALFVSLKNRSLTQSNSALTTTIIGEWPHCSSGGTGLLVNSCLTRSCYTREQLLRINESALSTSGDYVSASPSSSSLVSGYLTDDTSQLCRRLLDVGVHCRQLPCLPKRKAHRGTRRKPRLRHGALLPPPPTNVTTCTTTNTTTTPTLSSTHASLRIALFNARSVGLDTKRVEIAEFTRDNDLDILVLTETWLKECGDEAKCADLTPAGYSIRSAPRPSHGGGIAVIFRSSLTSHLSFDASLPFLHPSFEAVHVTLALRSHPLHLFCIYRPPPSPKNRLTEPMFFADFHELLDFSNGLNGSPLILGDINFHFNKPALPSTSKLLGLIEEFRFSQSVNEPTHVKGNILDWVMHRPEDAIVKSTAVTQALSSDHYCVMCELSASRPSPPSLFRTVRNLRALDMSAFRDDLQSALTSPVSAEQLYSVLRSTLDSHAPVSRRRVGSEKASPWYASVREELKVAKQQRRRAERQWIKSGLTVHKQIFSVARRLVTNIVHRAKSLFIRTQIAESTTSRQLFDICGRLCGRSTVSLLPAVYPSSQLPDVFCDYFINKVATIRSGFSQLPVPSTSSDVVSIHSFPSFQPILESDLKKIILQSRPTSCPLDPIPTPLLIECLDVLLPSLTSIINHSLQSGQFPSLFKSALVKPLLKKPSLDQNSLKNYRPVSNLSFLSKVLEKVVLHQLFSYLSAHDLLPHSQSAYRPHHSTETALVRVVDDLLHALDVGDVSVLTLLDLSAAFDTIDHSILLHRLSSLYGISGSALSWFESYLTDRTQAVMVDNLTSTSSPLSFGVPQGSVLGPVLFILYTKPLSSLLQSHSIPHQSFADDTQLYNSSKPNQTHALVQTMQTCISDVRQWMTDNRLKLNDDKTEALLIMKKNERSLTSPPTSIQVGSASIAFNSHARNLGFTVSSDLSLDRHVSNICRSAYFEIHRLSSIRKFLSVQVTNTLACAFILSKLDYCNVLLAGCPLYLINKLQKLQNSAARLVLHASKRDCATPLLKILHWLPIQARIDYKLSTICFNFFSGSSPAYISDLLSVYAPSRQLRSSSDHRLLCIPRVRTKTYGERTFSFRAATQWNSLPFDIRHAETLPSFKRALKTHLFKKHFD